MQDTGHCMINPNDEREYSRFYDYQIRYPNLNGIDLESLGFEIVDKEIGMNSDA